MAADTQELIAILAGAFPNAKLTRDSVRVYVAALADIEPAELEPVVRAWMLEGTWFPSLRELRHGVVEARLQLPGPDLAWETALQWANAPREIRCPAGCVRGLIEDPDGAVQLDRSLIPEDSILRDQLERIANASAQATSLCPTCEGTGQVPNPARRALPDALRRALDHVGGPAGINESDLSVVRAQFLKAYERTRADEVRRANLESAGLQLAGGPAIPAIERPS